VVLEIIAGKEELMIAGIPLSCAILQISVTCNREHPKSDGRGVYYLAGLQEVSSMLLDKLLAAGVGERPVVFVTHR
jgi:hypothetical protein